MSLHPISLGSRFDLPTAGDRVCSAVEGMMMLVQD